MAVGNGLIGRRVFHRIVRHFLFYFRSRSGLSRPRVFRRAQEQQKQSKIQSRHDFRGSIQNPTPKKSA